MKFYGIRNKKTKLPCSFSVESNEGGDCCVSVMFYLEDYDDYSIWLVADKRLAENILQLEEDNPWYNAGHSTPKISKLILEHLDDYEVFEIEVN